MVLSFPMSEGLRRLSDKHLESMTISELEKEIKDWELAIVKTVGWGASHNLACDFKARYEIELNRRRQPNTFRSIRSS